MQITDINGKLITVTDLNKAIKQTELFKDFRHDSDEYKNMAKQQRKYWRDIYRKLVQLKSSIKVE